MPEAIPIDRNREFLTDRLGNESLISSRITIDGFDQYSLGDYTTSDYSSVYGYYSNRTGKTSVVSSFSYTGSNSIYFDDPEGNNVIRSKEGSGANYYPSAGDEFEFYSYVANSGFNMGFGVAQAYTGVDYENGYYFQLNDVNNELVISRDGFSGNGTKFATSTYNFSSNNKLDTWLRTKVEWEKSGSFNVYVYDTSTGNELVSTSGKNTSYTNGGICWFGDDLADNTTPMYIHLDAATLTGTV